MIRDRDRNMSINIYIHIHTNTYGMTRRCKAFRAGRLAWKEFSKLHGMAWRGVAGRDY